MNLMIQTRLHPTPVYEVYWRFAAERQKIFYNRLINRKAPWTNDPILDKYKFTNAYRVLDRVSQYLLSHIILPDIRSNASAEDKLFRILFFKIFNKIETWQALENSLERIAWSSYSYSRYEKALNYAFEKGTIYSAAYIMASGCSSFGHERKHQNHLNLLEHMMKDNITEKVTSSSCMATLYEHLLAYPLIGPFLAYQYATDINYSDLVDFKENDFVIAGPGACDGIVKCFYDRGKFSNEDIIRLMMERQESEFSRLGIEFKNLFGRPLQLIDCQNLFCEVGKYARISHPDVKDKSGRKKIKQIYRYKGKIPKPAFPEKWCLSNALNDFFANQTREP